MARKIFIGDKVKTKYGVGKVIDARSWREAIADMNDYQAVEFSQRCQSEVGADFINKWVEILVDFGRIKRRILGTDVIVLEGRSNLPRGKPRGF